MFLSPGGEAVLALTGSRDQSSTEVSGAALRLRPIGARNEARARGRDELPGKVNYLRGSDRKQWRSGIRTYGKVAYEEIYPGVDLVYYGNQRQLEYDFIIRPGADPRVITLEIDGADRLDVDGSGDLVAYVGQRQVRQKKPIVYQEVDGVRREVHGSYRIARSRRVTFELGSYDRSLPLVIDPVFVYSTYVGGALEDAGSAVAVVAVDLTGNAYVTGYTFSSDFPTTSLATHNGSADAFVTKLDPTGTTLLYSTFLGGDCDDIGRGIAVDAFGSAYVTGSTCSTNFPTTLGAFDTTFNLGFDVFVTKLDPNGATLYSTFLGADLDEFGLGIAVDAAGSAYVTGDTGSGNFPTMFAVDPSHNGSTDAFVTKLDPTGTTLLYSTFLGDTGVDFGLGVAVDASGSAYVTGHTCSTNFPTTLGAFDTSHNGSSSPPGCEDVFVTKLHPTGTPLLYSTFLGGNTSDLGNGVAVDDGGSAYVAGQTCSTNFPTTPGAFDTILADCFDAFVTKLHPTGASLVYSTFLGGSGLDVGDAGYGVAVDAIGNAYVTGETSSADFPITADAPDATLVNVEAFVTKFDPAGVSLVYSTFLGGSSDDRGFGVAVDVNGSAYVTGQTFSVDFPTTAGAFDLSYNGAGDAFVTRIGDVAQLPPPGDGEDDDDFDDDGERDDDDRDDDNDGDIDDDDEDDDNDGERDDDDEDDDNDRIRDDVDSESHREKQRSSSGRLASGEYTDYHMVADTSTLLLIGVVDALSVRVEIYDPQGRLVAAAPSTLGRALATVAPLPGRYTIRVRNVDTKSIDYAAKLIARTLW